MSETTTTSLGEQVLSLLTAIDERPARIEQMLGAPEFDDDSPEMEAAVAQLCEEGLAEPGSMSWDEYKRTRGVE